MAGSGSSNGSAATSRAEKLVMCSYLTKRANVSGSAKGPSGWMRVTDAVVYLDHPYHAPYDHTLNIDFTSAEKGPSERVAVELTPGSARQLVEMINAALASAGALIAHESESDIPTGSALSHGG